MNISLCPWKFRIVALNLKNMFASPRRLAGCKNCPADFLVGIGMTELETTGEKGLEECRFIVCAQ